MFRYFIESLVKNDRRIAITSSLLAILSGLIFGLIIMLFTNPIEALPAFFTILTGGFQEGFTSIGLVLFSATPIILTGLAIGFAFKTGLFNIGASGQVMLGAFAAIYIGVKWTFLGPFQWIVALIFAGLAGALWAFLPGLLKAYRNVHEVVSTIMMNYIGLYLVLMLIKMTVFNIEKNQTVDVAHNAIIPSFGLNHIFGERSVNGGFFVAVIAVVIIYIILEKTTFGFQLKAVGHNRDASKYAGMNEKRNIILSLMISGFLAGLAGAVIYLTSSGRHFSVVEILNPEGFTGIPVALIGLSNPIGIFFAGIFMGYIMQGGWYMQVYDFAPEIIDIIIASIIYFSALVLLFKGILKRANKRYKKRNEDRGELNG